MNTHTKKTYLIDIQSGVSLVWPGRTPALAGEGHDGAEAAVSTIFINRATAFHDARTESLLAG